MMTSAGVLSLAGTIAFDFNSLANQTNDAVVQNYMNGLLSGIADKTHNGDRHIVRPGNGTSSLTLGDSNGPTVDGSSFTVGPTDKFIHNVAGTNEFEITFSGLPISTVKFDYETFPDGSCPSLSNCGKKRADLFEANGKRIAHFFGVAPGRNDTHLHSPASGSQKSVLASQGLGTFTWTFATPVTQLEFIDWPATIGIDNLKIDPAPEPSSVILLGTAIAAAFLAFLRKKGNKRIGSVERV